MSERPENPPSPRPAGTDPCWNSQAETGAAFARLVEIMQQLRAPGGCPWDREQDLMSLRRYLIEESYELLEAIESGDPEAHKEELGDLLLQVVFQAQIRAEEGRFDAAAVATGIADKMVRRHPHVFGGEQLAAPEALHRRWAEIKAAEKPARSAIAGVPRALPALLRAERITEKASRVGFDWPEVSGTLDKIEEERAELQAAMERGDRAEVEHELGDLLLSVVNLSRFLKVSAEDALSAAIERFSERFSHLEDALLKAGRQVQEASPEELDALWEAAKRARAGEADRPPAEPDGVL